VARENRKTEAAKPDEQSESATKQPNFLHGTPWWKMEALLWCQLVNLTSSPQNIIFKKTTENAIMFPWNQLFVLQLP